MPKFKRLTLTTTHTISACNLLDIFNEDIWPATFKMFPPDTVTQLHLTVRLLVLKILYCNNQTSIHGLYSDRSCTIDTT